MLLTCANHGDGGLDVYPLVRVDARVDEDEAVKVALLDAAESIFNGVVVLRERKREHWLICDRRGGVGKEGGATYEHALPSFVSVGIAVEVLGEAWLHMCPLVL